MICLAAGGESAGFGGRQRPCLRMASCKTPLRLAEIPPEEMTALPAVQHGPQLRRRSAAAAPPLPTLPLPTYSSRSLDDFGEDEVAEQNPWAEDEELGEGLEQQQQELAGV